MTPVARGSAGDACGWCRGPIPPGARSDSRFCCRRCRQTAFRLRRRSSTSDVSLSDRPATGPLLFAYADPPYPGMAKKCYGDQPEYAGEVDHVVLIASLETSYDGWALSTSARALRDILPLCPPEARVCAWVKPHGVSSATYGLHNAWEALIVKEGRRLRPGHPDRLIALPARGGGDLIGRKPLAFCAWLFDCLGILPGDTLVDLYPGTGVVGKAWAELSRLGIPATCSAAPASDDTSPTARAVDDAKGVEA